jgi:hypothetical protein
MKLDSKIRRATNQLSILNSELGVRGNENGKLRLADALGCEVSAPAKTADLSSIDDV